MAVKQAEPTVHVLNVEDSIDWKNKYGRQSEIKSSHISIIVSDTTKNLSTLSVSPISSPKWKP